MRKVRLWVGISVSAAMVAVGGGAATAALTTSAPPALRCTGTFASPGRIASGTYSSITVAGYCLVPRVGTIAVTGPLAVAAGGELSALSGEQILVGGNLTVQRNGVLLLGCYGKATPLPSCKIRGNYWISNNDIRGNLTATDALGVVVHGAVVEGSLTVTDGGGGATATHCAPSNKFLGNPVYTDFEDNTVAGSLSVTGLTSCYFGLFRNFVSGTMTVKNNTMGDPDGNEVASNGILGNLSCSGNSPKTQIGDSGGSKNAVAGTKSGQCSAL